MKIYGVGVDPLWISRLKEHGYEGVGCQTLPDPSVTQEHALLISGTEVPISKLTELREQFPDTELVYACTENGISGWHAATAICNSLGVRFLRPGIGIESLLEHLDVWFQDPSDKPANLIGVFGTLPGVGVTRIAATLAQVMTKKKVIMLGLNLYNTGWEGETAVSLDRWRQRLIARVLQPEDLDNLISTNDFRYLPGNDDILSVHDYEENEMEHLLEIAQKEADIVITDFGAIPESAAWYCGLQRSAIRVMVTHPTHTRRLSTLMKLSGDLGIASEHWFIVSNRAREADVSLKTIAQAHNMQPLVTLGYKGNAQSFTLPLDEKEQEQFKRACHPILTAMGIEVPKKKGWF